MSTLNPYPFAHFYLYLSKRATHALESTVDYCSLPLSHRTVPLTIGAAASPRLPLESTTALRRAVVVSDKFW